MNELRDKFPDLTPIRSGPSLGTFNGIGMMMYGRRDYDEETDTYISTHCFVAFFAPLLMLGSYRVSDAGDGGWYFVGKVPLSILAKLWNGVILSCILAGVGFAAWSEHTRSPEYIAARNLERAEELAESNRMADAVRLYCRVIQSDTVHATTATRKIRLLMAGELEIPPTEFLSIVESVRQIQRQGAWQVEPEILIDQTISWLKQHSDTPGGQTIEILDAATPFGFTSSKLTAFKQKSLEKLVQSEPDNVDAASQLAVIYESHEKLDKCLSLLSPHAKNLGITEGARILGQIFAQQGEFHNSYELLTPYVEQRLSKLHQAEEKFATALSNAEERVFQQIRQDEAPGWFYRKYDEASDDDERSAIVQEYVSSQIRNESTIKNAQEDLARAAGIVTVALDLGIVTLRRAQEIPSATERQSELERAEKTFLAIQGVAGDSDDYKLYLGQVYYWLGKHDQGHELFDEVLAAKNRDFLTLMSVAGVLRAVGIISEFRDFTEEAYGKAKNDEERQTAAIMRAIEPKDVDDEIQWLRKANTNLPHVKASLESSLGQKAMLAGDDKLAQHHLELAILAYLGMPETATSLNNIGGAYMSLYRVTGDDETFKKGVESYEKAIALDPSGAILLSNVGRILVGKGIQDLIGDQLDLKALKLSREPENLNFLATNESQLDEFRQQIQKNGDIIRGLEYLNKLLVLSPKRVIHYSELLKIYSYTNDVQALRRLLTRVKEVELDVDESVQEALDLMNGKIDEKRKEHIETAIARLQTIIESEESTDKATHSCAVSFYARYQLGQSRFVDSFPIDDLIQQVEKAHGAQPTLESSATLQGVLLHRAGETLKTNHQIYAELFSEYGASLGHWLLIANQMVDDSPLREQVLANPDVQRVIQLIREESDVFPNQFGTWDWAMMRAADPDFAKSIAESIQENESRRLSYEIQSYLSPVSVSNAYSRYWQCQIEDNDAAAKDVLQELRDRGVRLP